MQFQTLLTRLAAASALALAAVGAHAETYAFTLTAAAQNESWQLASSPTPQSSDVYDGIGFALFDVALSSSAGLMGFYSSQAGGGLILGSSTYFDEYRGVQLYTGSESAPTFKLGSFDLRSAYGGGPATLTISALPVTAVPEPATVALMLAGLGMVGGAAARRRKAGREEPAVA